MRDFPFASYFHGNWAKTVEHLGDQRPGSPVVYLPLSYFPESTIDYWIGNKKAIAYEPLVLEMIRELARDNIVIVKEHLHMMGARRASFLKSLKEIPGCVSVHPRELSNEVVALADAVLLGSGSPGIEATIRGKPVFTFCNTSYWYRPSGATFLDLDQIDQWSGQIRAVLAAFEKPTAGELLAFIKGCLKSSTRVAPGIRIWPLLQPDDLRAVLDSAIRADHAAAAL